MKYEITFRGRTANALGITYRITDIFEGDTIEVAKLSMYDKYEHIHIISVKELKP